MPPTEVRCMSSLHQDHLLAEGSEPARGAGSDPRHGPRNVAEPVEEKATSTVPAQRQGKPQRTGSAQTTADVAAPASRRPAHGWRQGRGRRRGTIATAPRPPRSRRRRRRPRRPRQRPPGRHRRTVRCRREGRDPLRRCPQCHGRELVRQAHGGCEARCLEAVEDDRRCEACGVEDHRRCEACGDEGNRRSGARGREARRAVATAPKPAVVQPAVDAALQARRPSLRRRARPSLSTPRSPTSCPARRPGAARWRSSRPRRRLDRRRPPLALPPPPSAVVRRVVRRSTWPPHWSVP